MWKKLDAEYKIMDDHARQQEQDLRDFVRTLEPIYRHYNVSLPPLPTAGSGASSSQDDADGAYTPSHPSYATSQQAESSIEGDEVDGMTFVLIMLDHCFRDLQHICDEEYIWRVQRRHNRTIAAIQERSHYKKVLLTNLFNHPDAKVLLFAMSIAAMCVIDGSNQLAFASLLVASRNQKPETLS